jgi:hypothetical protein
MLLPATRSQRSFWLRKGSLILEASIGLAFASVLTLLLLKGSMVGLSSNQWTVMQTLTDAYLTRETALANRIPLADVVVAGSQWPDPTTDTPARNEMTVALGKLAGGIEVSGQLVRFRSNETQTDDATTGTTIYRLYSVLSYRVNGKDYFKSRSTLRMQ